MTHTAAFAPTVRDYSFLVRRVGGLAGRCEECGRQAPLYRMRVHGEPLLSVCFLCIGDVAERWGISEGAIQQCLELLEPGRVGGDSDDA